MRSPGGLRARHRATRSFTRPETRGLRRAATTGQRRGDRHARARQPGANAGDRSGRRRTGNGACGRRRRQIARCRYCGVRPQPFRGPTRNQQDLCQALHGAACDPDRALRGRAHARSGRARARRFSRRRRAKGRRLAAGKGVVVCDGTDQARTVLEEWYGKNAIPGGGTDVVLEERMIGPEISVFAIGDGRAMIPVAAACDYKRAGDGDAGPNTGGMGAYSPPGGFPEDALDIVRERIVAPVLRGLLAEDEEYRGVLYCGLMGPRRASRRGVQRTLRRSRNAGVDAACDRRLRALPQARGRRCARDRRGIVFRDRHVSASRSPPRAIRTRTRRSPGFRRPSTYPTARWRSGERRPKRVTACPRRVAGFSP